MNSAAAADGVPRTLHIHKYAHDVITVGNDLDTPRFTPQ
jgi:hypothetical protein